MVGLVFYLVFLVVCLFVLYYVIRKAVHHGILDADAGRQRVELDRTWPTAEDKSPR